MNILRVTLFKTVWLVSTIVIFSGIGKVRQYPCIYTFNYRHELQRVYTVINELGVVIAIKVTSSTICRLLNCVCVCVLGGRDFTVIIDI